MPLGEDRPLVSDQEMKQAVPSVGVNTLMPLVRNVCEAKSTAEETMPPTASRKFPVLSTRRLTVRARDTKGCACVSGAVVGPRRNAFFQLARCAVHDTGRTFVRWMSKAHGSGKVVLDHRDQRLKGAGRAIRFNSFERKWRGGQSATSCIRNYWGKG
jgi:hypothetical protein